MNKLDILYRSTKKEPFFVDVPRMNYLTFDGCGHPDEPDFQLACETLYTIAYTIKYEIAKKKMNMEYKVNPMEVSWLLKKSEERSCFTWTMSFMQPDWVDEKVISEAVTIAVQRGKNIAHERVKLQSIEYGKCIQCFHKGDYDNMNDTLSKMLAFADCNGVKCSQYTHDIYLNNMRKTAKENYKTIMRTALSKAI